MAEKIVLQLEHISKTIRKAQILQDISLRMESGKIYGFQGYNGSGKTMLMRAISGLIRIDEGQILENGRRLGQDMTFLERTGILLEGPAFLGAYTGYQNLKYLADIQKRIGAMEVREALIRVGLDPDDKRKYRKYSLGMKQRLGIAAAIMESNDILLIDEPFNALDVHGVEKVKQILWEEKERGALLILACHERQLLEQFSDEIFVIEKGCIVDHLFPESEVL